MMIRTTAYRADGTIRWSKDKRTTELPDDIAGVIYTIGVTKVTLTFEDGHYNEYTRAEGE